MANRGRPKKNYNLTEAGRTERSLRMKKENGTLPAVTEEEFDYNKRLIEYSLAVQENAKTADINNPETLRDCFLNYLQLCIASGFRVGNLGACTAMRIDNHTLLDWRDRRRRANDPRYKELADLVSSTCSLSREQLISESKINPVIGIFWQRNYDGLRNDTEQQQTIADNDQTDYQTAQDYRKKYGRLIGE